MQQAPFPKPAYEGDRILWVPEICERAGVARMTVYKWIQGDKFPFVHLGGRRGIWESDFLELTQPKPAA